MEEAAKPLLGQYGLFMLSYTGEFKGVFKGHVTGQRYEFGPGHTQCYVDLRDIPAFLAMGLFEPVRKTAEELAALYAERIGDDGSSIQGH